MQLSVLSRRPETAEINVRPGLWSPLHAAVLDGLFGEGYVAPPGTFGIDKLGQTLGLSSRQTVLLLGAGTGGPALSLAGDFGCGVIGFEAVEAFAQAARQRVRQAGLDTRASIAPWSSAASAPKPQSFDHAIALMPLRGAAPETILGTIGTALKPGGHLVLLEIVVAPSCDADDPLLRSWMTLDQRPLPPPDAADMGELLERLGFDVRAVEDVTEAHVQATLACWQRLLHGIRKKPTPVRATVMMAEAERSMLCSELMRIRKLRLARWHLVQDTARRIDVGAMKLEIMLSVQFRDWRTAIALWRDLAQLQGDVVETRNLYSFINERMRQHKTPGTVLPTGVGPAIT
jgi:cyclopropane fatty-acyl-phospholipid synthase-like methyltransferase